MKNKDYCVKDFQKKLNKSKSDYFHALFGFYDYHNQIYSILKNNTSTKNCQNDNNLIIKICMPDEGISAFTLSHLLNDLYIVNRELNKIIIHGLEEETGKKLDIKNIFELKIKEVRPGSCIIVTSIVLPIVIAEMINPFVNELTDGILKMLSVACARFLKEVLSKPDFLNNETIKKYVADFYKRIHKLKNVQEVQYIIDNETEKVTKDRMIDFYA